ncbi:MAG: hypothetical protein R3C11_28515 [Planctomycetaceae bacterium]
MSERRSLVTVCLLTGLGIVCVCLGNRLFSFHQYSEYVGLTEYGYNQWQLFSFLLFALIVSAGAFLLEGVSMSKENLWKQAPRIFFRFTLLVILVPVISSLLIPLLRNTTLGVEEGRGVFRYEPGNRTVLTEAEQQQKREIRRKHIQQLKTALWEYADAHEGQLPPSIAESNLAKEIWVAPECFHIYYDYYTTDISTSPEERRLVLHEPRILQGKLFVVWSNGEIEEVEQTEVQQLRKELLDE